MAGEQAHHGPAPDALIVGGGLAGLTCAVGLAEAGLKVVVIERDGILGGRARSWTDPHTGDPVHIGPHVLMTEYPNMFALMDRLGTRDKVIWQDDRFITLTVGREQVVIKAANLPPPMQFLPSLVSIGFGRRNLASNMGATLYAMQMDEEDVRRLDGMNAYAFLRMLGVRREAIDSFWAFTSMAIMNVPLELCSAGAIMRLYKRLIGKQRYHFGFPDGGLGDLFAPQARAFIEARGGAVLLKTEVAAFTGTDDRVTGVRLADGREILAPLTVAALPPRALARLARPEWPARHRVFGDARRFHPSPYVSTFLWFDRKLTDLRMWARGKGEGPNDDFNCDFYDLSNIHRGWEARPSVITCNAIFAHRGAEMSDQEVIATTVREIAEFLPEARLDRVRHAVVNRIPMAIHCPFPGTERLRPATRTGVEGLLLAGDWIATGLPSSMESACMAGWRAAEAVLAEQGARAELAVDHGEIEGITALVDRAARLRPSRLRRRFAEPDPAAGLAP